MPKSSCNRFPTALTFYNILENLEKGRSLEAKKSKKIAGLD
jgi:hypothetical protein